MAFPISPTEGQTYKKYKFSSNRWEYLSPLKIPSDPVAYWSLDDVPEIPDDPAGQYYRLPAPLIDRTEYGFSTVNITAYKGMTLDVRAIAGRGSVKGAGYPAWIFYATDWTWGKTLDCDSDEIKLYQKTITIPNDEKTYYSTWYHYPNATSGNSTIMDCYIGTGKYLNSGLVDNSGNGNHATIYGATPVSGISGNALSFDGVNDHVDAIIDKTFTAYTISFWRDKSLGKMAFGASNNSWYDYGEHSWKEPNGEYYHGIDFSAVPSRYMFTVTWDGSILKIYINGELKGSKDWVYTSAYLYKIMLGYYGSGSDHMYLGTIDEPRIYNRALSEAEIKSLYLLRKDNIYVLD